MTDVPIAKILPELSKLLKRVGEQKGLIILNCIEDLNKVREKYGEEIAEEAIKFVFDLAKACK